MLVTAMMLYLILSILIATPVSGGDVGILYEVWHTRAAQAMKAVEAQGGRQLTVEAVIRSNGALQLNDVYGPYNISADIYNVKPELGFYCLYRHRPGETPLAPDCDNITQTATAHASLLVNAGVDYIAADITNWPSNSSVTDVSVIRPTQVLAEEWLKLRQQGIKTPQIAIWPCSPTGSNTWKILLDSIYNNASYSDLIYKQDGKMVVFLPYRPGTCYDAATEALIQSNGGRDNVKTIPMWALFGPQTYTQGVWGFFSPCTSSQDPGRYTTSMIQEPSCNQHATTESGHVTEVTASSSYMLSMSALPFAAPGHMRGLTMQRLFTRVLEARAPHLFLSSFNEHIGGRQQCPTSLNTGFNMGLPSDGGRFSCWVDTYGSEFSRDMEPTVEGGRRVYDVMASCVSLYKQNMTCADRPEEACCTTADKNVFANIWSLTLTDGEAQFLTTNSPEERTALLGKGWREICHPVVGPSDFCVDSSLKDGRFGPFIVYNIAQSAPATPTVPLYRCITPQKTHVMSTAEDCEGLGTAESVLGHIASARGGEMVRGLYRCNTHGVFSHALDLNCDNPGTLLGFVR